MATRRVALALQGGGAHGAFTWGVLERLLEVPDLEIVTVSGTSAGALNGAALVQGLNGGGREAARASLRRLWEEVAAAARRHNPWGRNLLDRIWGGNSGTAENWSLDRSPSWIGFDLMLRLFGPERLNPAGMGPLRDVLDRTLDLPALRSAAPARLFVCATSLRSGKLRVFDGAALGADALLASACVPQLFPPVWIDHEPYWDGGFMGNPPLFPLIYAQDAPADIVIVQVSPINRESVPTTASEVINRVNEISFNASLLRELRAVDFVSSLIEREGLDETRYRRVRLHLIGAEAEMAKFGVASKFNAELEFLEHLRGVGRTAADAWLDRDAPRLGQASTLDMAAMTL